MSLPRSPGVRPAHRLPLVRVASTQSPARCCGSTRSCAAPVHVSATHHRPRGSVRGSHHSRAGTPRRARRVRRRRPPRARDGELRARRAAAIPAGVGTLRVGVPTQPSAPTCVTDAPGAGAHIHTSACCPSWRSAARTERGERVRLIAFDERDGAAGESATRHPRAEAARARHRRLDDRVERGAGHLEVVTQADVTVASSGDRVRAHRRRSMARGRGQRAGVLGHHVPGAPAIDARR